MKGVLPQVLAGLIMLSSGPAQADVSTVVRTFVDVCPPALLDAVSPAELGMEPLQETISPVITKELIERMPGVFWRTETENERLTLSLQGMTCGVGGAAMDPAASLQELEASLQSYANALELISAETVASSTAGIHLELCHKDADASVEHRTIGQVSQGLEGWQLQLTLHRDAACLRLSE